MEVDYWGGDECGLWSRARANCLWNGSTVTGEEEEGCQTCRDGELDGGGDVSPPCATFRLHGVRGVRRGGGRNILPSTPVAAKRTTGVSSQDEALEEAAVGMVGERGGRPGPHPKPNKGWGPSGAYIRRVPLGLVGCWWHTVRGETEGGAGGIQFGGDPSPPWAYKKGS